jgi:hypothetical protein
MPSDLIRGWVPVRVKKTRQNKNFLPENTPEISPEASLQGRFGADIRTPPNTIKAGAG